MAPVHQHQKSREINAGTLVNIFPFKRSACSLRPQVSGWSYQDSEWALVLRLYLAHTQTCAEVCLLGHSRRSQVHSEVEPSHIGKR